VIATSGGVVILNCGWSKERHILVITDSCNANVFVGKFPFKPPPVPKMEEFLFQYHLVNFVAVSNQKKLLIAVFKGIMTPLHVFWNN